MTGRAGVTRARGLAGGVAVIAAGLLLLVGCKRGAKPAAARPVADLPPAQRDAEVLAQEIFEMVDRAMDYRGSHRGRPAASLRQMGVDSLTPTMVRRIVNVNREPVITVAYRQPDQHEIVSCRGDGQILEEAAVGGGRFTVMCENNAGAQRPIQVGGTGSP